MSKPANNDIRPVEFDLTNGKQVFELLLAYLGLEVIERYDQTQWVMEMRKKK